MCLPEACDRLTPLTTLFLHHFPQGWNGNQADNSLGMSEVHQNLASVRRFMGDLRTGSTGWVDIPEREVNYKVRSANSMLDITVSDVFGCHAINHGDMCAWRITMNGVPVDKHTQHHSSSRNGWRIEPNTLRVYVPSANIQQGNTYNFRMQWVRGGSASECLQGWSPGSVHNTFSIVEIPAKPADSLVTYSPQGAWPDTRPKNTGWENIPGRVMQFSKLYDDTSVSVTYMDSMGYVNAPHDQSWLTEEWALLADHSYWPPEY